ncbi:YybH family protein [Lysobacter enzymogenes]|uniref:YybH family protein n=1 Tax=Lysobacter enzymogenes TaxID=69 RepID=UPI00384E9454
MSETHDPFLAALDGYAAAVAAKDVDAFAALYAEDVHVFDMWGRWELRGLAAWRAMAQEWFGSLGTETVAVTYAQAQSQAGAELAYGHAVLTYAAHAADGTRLRSLDNRISLALARRDGAWKIVHEHTSAPVDHASGKAMLKRDAAE